MKNVTCAVFLPTGDQCPRFLWRARHTSSFQHVAKLQIPRRKAHIQDRSKWLHCLKHREPPLTVWRRGSSAKISDARQEPTCPSEDSSFRPATWTLLHIGLFSFLFFELVFIVYIYLIIFALPKIIFCLGVQMKSIKLYFCSSCCMCLTS